MSALSLNEEQTKLLRICIKNAEPLKPDWEKVKEEAELVSTSAASQRWGRLYKLLIGDEKPSTPSKAKGKAGTGDSKQKAATSKKAAAPKAPKTHNVDMNEQADGKNTAQPVPQTPKKRMRTHESELDSEVEIETPAKTIKTEIKEEDT